MKKRSILLVIIFCISIIILLVNSNNKYLVKEESLATYIDEEKTDSFPAKGTVAFSKAECDNNTNIYWDNDTWGLYITNLSEKTKCNLYFKTLENAVTKITNLASSDATNMATDDPDNNIRYIGANPNNYIYFNCDDYNNQTSDTCELWRIIGVFNNIEKEDGTKENLIKIVRNDSIGDYSWSTSASSDNNGSGSGEWEKSSILKLLNPGYDAEETNGSLYYNAKKGTCYVGKNNLTQGCDFTLTGLKNDRTKNMIETVMWNLGGSTTHDIGAETYYEKERGKEVYESRASTWIGKIGLIYASDYGYATSGGNSTSRDTCIKSNMYEWDSIDVSDCKSNNYLYTENYQWILSLSSNSYSYIYHLYPSGGVCKTNTYRSDNTRPSLFLKSNISIGIGDGSLNTPYQLGL